MDEQYFSRLVTYDEVKDNGYVLSVSSYVEPEDKTEKIDITELNARIASIVKRQHELRVAIDAIVLDLEGGAA